MATLEDTVQRQTDERGAAEVRWLEELLASSPATDVERLTQRSHQRQDSRGLAPVLLLIWPIFLLVLFSIPAPEAASAPAWAEEPGLGMVVALLLTLAGFLRSSLGYGAFGATAGFGMALGIGYFATGLNARCRVRASA